MGKTESNHLKPKVILFDVDGVFIIPKTAFAAQYAKEQGIDPKAFKHFFQTDFRQAMAGQADLKELLERNRELWQWPGNIDGLIARWFGAENYPNTALVELVRKFQRRGVACYLATNQEKYRADYIKNQMFPSVFDGFFISCELGCLKPSRTYLDSVLSYFAKHGIKAQEIIYFDDNPKNVTAARGLGLQGIVYRSNNQVEKLINQLALP